MVNLKNLALGIGIIVVFGLALGYGIEAFYPSPEWDDYCGKIVVPQTFDSIGNLLPVTQDQCESIEGAKWEGYSSPRPIKLDSGIVSETGYCNYHYQCQIDFEDAQDEHSKKAFIISIIVGLIAIVIGYSVLSIEPVGSALLGSGIWSFIYGGAVNWRNFSDYWRFGLLFVVLILLIWIGISLNRRDKKKGFWRFLSGFGFK